METTLPASEHIERVVLGAAMLYPAALTDAVAGLQPEDFFLPSHRTIFRAILTLNGQHVDSSTVRERLLQRKELESIGGYAYLLNLEDGIPRNFNVADYCRILRSKAQARELVKIHADGQEDASDPAADPLTLIESTSARLRELLDDQTADIQSVGQYLAGEPEQMFERMATTGGLSLGFSGLDSIHGGQLVIVAARPSMGKTAWACNAASSIASRNHVTALFALEQGREDMVRRMFSSSTKVPYQQLRDNQLSPAQKTLLLDRRAEMSGWPLYIDDQPKPTIRKIRAKCQRLQRTSGLSAVLIDQLSKVDPSDVRQKGMPKHEWVGAQSTALKQMAQELNVPVVVFNQIRRHEKKTDIVPRLEDLKESGSLEEDADVVILLHRPSYYGAEESDVMITAKSREGRTGSVECMYQGNIMRWEPRW